MRNPVDLAVKSNSQKQLFPVRSNNLPRGKTGKAATTYCGTFFSHGFRHPKPSSSLIKESINIFKSDIPRSQNKKKINLRNRCYRKMSEKKHAFPVSILPVPS
jgi:hypothetical protein